MNDKNVGFENGVMVALAHQGWKPGMEIGHIRKIIFSVPQTPAYAIMPSIKSLLNACRKR